MKRSLLFVAITLFTLVVSCKESEYAEYEGSWSGIYEGEDYGTWSVTVDDNGQVSGVARSDSFPGLPFDVTGSVSTSGDIQASANVVLGTIDFDGRLAGSGASGLWTNVSSNLNGTWEGSRR